MKINELKKETGLTQKQIAQFFNMTYGAFANSSAKERYQNALCKFYFFLRYGEKKENINLTKDALEVRQQIDFDLPELLEKYNEAMELIKNIYLINDGWEGEKDFKINKWIEKFLNKQ